MGEPNAAKQEIEWALMAFEAALKTFYDAERVLAEKRARLNGAIYMATEGKKS